MNKDEMIKSWLRLCQDPRTSNELLEKACYWESISNKSDLQIRMAAARNRNAGSELLGRLAGIQNLPIQIAIARHENLSEVTAGKLLKSQFRELRRSLAGNPKIPIFVMRRLAKDFEDVRLRLARNPALIKDIMINFAKEGNAKLRASLAGNEYLPEKILEFLSRDENREVRIQVVKHPRVPAKGLLLMAHDSNTNVREAVFERAKHDFPQETKIFEVLAQFSDALVADRAKAHLEAKEQTNGENEPETDSVGT